MLIDGQARRSCVTAAGDVGDRAITTVEGLAQGDVLDAVQQAWIEENVPQCGYCQSGQIISAVALLARRPAPTDDDIDAVMSANLCRCGTYPRIRKAIVRAATLARTPGPGGTP